LYDINQRKFIETAPEGSLPVLSENSCEVDRNKKREVYLVHYNGFVFGANYAKMIIIREREVD
jgi:hypothetical protein